MRSPTVAVLLVGLLARPALGREDHRELARDHFRRGTALYTLNHYQQAIDEFEAGYAESPEPAFLFNLAQAHARLGEKALALDFYSKYLELGALPADVPLVKENIERLSRELEAATAPKPASPPPPQPTPPTVVAPPRAIEVAAPQPSPTRHPWAIGVGIAAAVAVIALVIGLSVGLSGREPGELWSVH